MKYRKGKELVVVDTLSRSYLKQLESENDNEVQEYIHCVLMCNT
jgi:hypothetical protein